MGQDGITIRIHNPPVKEQACRLLEIQILHGKILRAYRVKNEISYKLISQIETSYSYTRNFNLSKLDRKRIQGSALYSHSNP